MTLTKALHDISEQLSVIYEKNEADTIAEILMEGVTDSKKTDRILNKDKELTAAQIEKINQFLPRLLNHGPIQYILNECWFLGLKFYVDKNVLIPRPETEELGDWVIRNIKFPFKELKILDIGTGSGCIPVSLKRKLRKAEVWACDVSNDALTVAKRNADNLQADINFIQLDFLNEQERNKLPSFDIIVSNPPYIPQKDKETMQQNVLAHEPHTALFVSDNNPLVFYAAITDFATQHLNKDGSIYCEIHENLGKEVSEIFLQNNFEVEIKKDMQGKDRMIKAFMTG
jgi:release factor glutamine methyltransferase